MSGRPGHRAPLARPRTRARSACATCQRARHPLPPDGAAGMPARQPGAGRRHVILTLSRATGATNAHSFIPARGIHAEPACSDLLQPCRRLQAHRWLLYRQNPLRPLRELLSHNDWPRSGQTTLTSSSGSRLCHEIPATRRACEHVSAGPVLLAQRTYAGTHTNSLVAPPPSAPHQNPLY